MMCWNARVVNRPAAVRELDQLGFGAAHDAVGVRRTVGEDDVDHALRLKAVRSFGHPMQRQFEQFHLTPRDRALQPLIQALGDEAREPGDRVVHHVVHFQQHPVASSSHCAPHIVASHSKPHSSPPTGSRP